METAKSLPDYKAYIRSLDGGCKFQAWAVAGMSVGQFLTSVRQSCSPDRRVRGEVPARPPGLPPISKSHSDTLQRGPAD
ncbi:hypothetical protein R1flu_015306 [Riccia fluitans]|uniref:Uncharacterized protein n=1 Tax=Riccia fluitans TaxID=41844 RepID=A0ABD1YIX2_9MARC